MDKLKLVTKTAITINDPSKPVGTKQAVVEGYLQSTNWTNDFTSTGANYVYQEVDGSVVKNGGKTFDQATVDGLYDAVKAKIPVGLGYCMTQQWIYYLAFQQEMAITFGILASDIEIVVITETE